MTPALFRPRRYLLLARTLAHRTERKRRLNPTATASIFFYMPLIRCQMYDDDRLLRSLYFSQRKGPAAKLPAAEARVTCIQITPRHLPNMRRPASSHPGRYCYIRCSYIYALYSCLCVSYIYYTIMRYSYNFRQIFFK